MRILHVSNNALPDMRVEKTAWTLRKHGHENHFVGPESRQYLGAFDKLHTYSHGGYVKTVFDLSRRHRLRKIVESVRPDIIVANNIVSAKDFIDSRIPLVYDDHEYWSMSVKSDPSYTKDLPMRVRSAPFRYLVPRWERQIVSKFVTIVTHEAVAEEYRKYTEWVGVVPNYPLMDMVRGLNLRQPRQGVVYSGCDFRRNRFSPIRDMTGLRGHVEFDVICGLPHRQMMERLTQYRVGLTPWRFHLVHLYKDQNRNYEYFHAGLQVIMNRQLARRFQHLKFVHSYDDYSELPDLIRNLPDIDPEEIAGHAQRNYVWELNEKTILEACERALRK